MRVLVEDRIQKVYWHVLELLDHLVFAFLELFHGDLSCSQNMISREEPQKLIFGDWSILLSNSLGVLNGCKVV